MVVVMAVHNLKPVLADKPTRLAIGASVEHQFIRAPLHTMDPRSILTIVNQRFNARTHRAQQLDLALYDDVLTTNLLILVMDNQYRRPIR